jgi:uncharacterized protein
MKSALFSGLKLSPTRAVNPVAKFLILLAVGIVVYLIVSRMRRQGEPRSAPPSRASQPAQGEDMVRCDACGVHLPRSESFTSRNRFYCSDEHRRLGPQPRG